MSIAKHGMKARRFLHSELKVRAIARRRANKQLMRVPWDRFHKAYEEYLRWEALALWVRTIAGAEGGVPSLLAATLRKHCPGFIENEALLNEPRLLGFRFHEWIHNHIFDFARREGWLDALTFYGVRDLRSQSSWTYWEYCEQEWHRRRPASYPSFEKWLCLAINYNPHHETSVANIDDGIERHIEWKTFDCWCHPLLGTKIELPRRIVAELERRCPGFLQASSPDFMRGRAGEQVKTQRHLMTWIEDHFFSEPKKEGWFDLIRQQTRMHPRYARIEQYSKRWDKTWSQNPTVIYPSFVQWRHAAENYVED